MRNHATRGVGGQTKIHDFFFVFQPPPRFIKGKDPQIAELPNFT